MSILSCAKAGPDSHRSMLGYETNAAPWGTDTCSRNADITPR